MSEEKKIFRYAQLVRPEDQRPGKHSVYIPVATGQESTVADIRDPGWEKKLQEFNERMNQAVLKAADEAGVRDRSERE